MFPGDSKWHPHILLTFTQLLTYIFKNITCFSVDLGNFQKDKNDHTIFKYSLNISDHADIANISCYVEQSDISLRFCV